MKRTVMVWDWPTRVFHWSLALAFATAWLTAESERLRLVHVLCGYSVAGLIAFRIVWGLVGSRYARFADFLRGPRAVLVYLAGLVRGRPARDLGHNPAGAVAIVLLLGLGAATAVSGFALYQGLAGESFEEVHEALATLMAALVLVHALAVIVSSRLHRENLVASMLDGRKAGDPGQSIPHTHGVPALALLAALAGLWIWGLGMAPVDATGRPDLHGEPHRPAQAEHEHDHDDDDD